MNLVLLGAPGAGKGTVAEYISMVLGIPAISTGNILRSAVKNETPIGLQAKNYMDRGALVPDDVVIGVVKERLAEKDCLNGCILDGIPRTTAQAEALELVGLRIDSAVLLDVDDSVIEKRLTGRRSCPVCGATFHITNSPPKIEGKCDLCSAELTVRKDDEPITVRNRLKTYHTETEPLVNYYGALGRLFRVDGSLPIEEVRNSILSVLGILR